MNLKIILPIKKIVVNDKTISIPKLGLKHYNLLNCVKGPDEHLNTILDNICPGLTAAESDIVVIHLLAFNGKLKDEVEKNGFTYKINDIYISQILEHRLDGKTFKFKAPKRYDKLGSIDNILDTYFESIDGNTDKPNFMKLPAFVVKWVDDIVNTVAIPGPNGPIKGILKIMEIFE